MKITCDNMELLYSNRINCFNGKSIRLEHDFGDGGNLIMVFNFNYNGEKASYKYYSPVNGTVIFDLFNFNSNTGIGLKYPIEVATYGGKKCYVVFFVYKLPEANPILDFSLYKEI